MQAIRQTSITCNVIDRRTGTPAVGVRVLLRCLHEYPNYDQGTFEGITDQNGYVLGWNSKNNPEMTLLQYLFDHQSYEQMCWQMRFHTTDYFVPIQPYYTSADICFVLRRSEQAPNVTLYADIRGFGTWIEPFAPRETALQPENPPAQHPRQYFRLSSNQNKALTEHFVDEPYPSRQSYSKLSGDLNLRLETTRRWFKRRRNAHRQMIQSRSQQSPGYDNPREEMDHDGMDQLKAIAEEAEGLTTVVNRNHNVESRFCSNEGAMDFESTSPANATQSIQMQISTLVGDTYAIGKEPNLTSGERDDVRRVSHSSLDRILESTTETNDGVVGIEGGVGGMTLVQCGGKVVRRSTRRGVQKMKVERM